MLKSSPNPIIQHGGDIYSYSRLLNCKPSDIIDFSSNMNPLKPQIPLDYTGINITPYPDPTYQSLKQCIMNYYNINYPYDIALYNGASSAIHHLIELLQPQSMILYAPIYLEYEKSIKKNNIPYHTINRLTTPIEPFTENNFIFVNPSTPDGKYYEVYSPLKSRLKINSIMIFDESFLEFTKQPSVLNYLSGETNIYIIKSLTKIFSCGGVRVGFVISHQDNIKRLIDSSIPWYISCFDEYYIQSVLKDKSFVEKSFQNYQPLKNKLYSILKESPLIKNIYPSDANYFLTESNIDGYTLQKCFEPYKILIRVCDNFQYLNEYHIRFAVKEDSHLDRLKYALSEIESTIP